MNDQPKSVLEIITTGENGFPMDETIVYLLADGKTVQTEVRPHRGKEGQFLS